MSDHIQSALAIASDLRKAERNVDRNPTEAQKAAGTYRKGHMKAHGLDITIENPKGSERSGIGRDGKRWVVKMPATYGYVKGTEGNDGDHVDVYLGPDHASQKVFVVDQINAETGKYDEHKCLLSFANKSDALNAYKHAFSDGKGKDRIGDVTEMSVSDFRDWLKSGNTKKPLGNVKSYATGGAVMPLIKSANRDAVSKNIATERNAGRDPKQALAIALDVARRAKKRKRNGFADGGIPGLPEAADPTERVLDGEVLAPLTNRERRAIQRRAMAGIAPSGTELAKLDADRLRLEQNTERLANFLTPFPAYGELAADPSIATATNAGVKTIAPFSLLGAAGVLGAGYGAAAAKDLGLLDTGASAQTARESNAKARAAAAEGKAARDRAESERQLSLQRMQESDAALERERKAAAKDEYDRAVKLAEDNLKAEKAEARSKYPRFEDTATGQVFNKVGVATPFLGTMVAGALTRAAMGKSGGPISSAVKDWIVPGGLGALEGAFAANWPLIHPLWFSPAANPDKAPYEHYARDLPASHPRKAEWTNYAERIPGENPERREASKELYDIDKFIERSALGAGEGVAGGLIGAKLGKAGVAVGRGIGDTVEGIGTLPGRAATGWARGMEAADEARARALSVARDVQGLRQTGQTQQQRLHGEQQQLGRQDQLLGEADHIKPNAGRRSQDSASGGAEAGPASKSPSTDLVPVKDPSPKPVVPTNPTRTPPKIATPKGMSAQRADDLHSNFRAALKTKPIEDITLADLRSGSKTTKWTDAQLGDAETYLQNLKSGYLRASERAGVGPEVLATALDHIPRRSSGGPIDSEPKHHSHYQPRLEGRFSGGPVYPSHAPVQYRSYQDGGAIDQALAIAGRYAQGGSVHVGAVVGETGGVDDKVPLSVKAGSYVLPAYAVSGWPGAGNNTAAGMKALTKIFGAPSTMTASAGGAVPIKISHGEFVVSPEKVLEIGRGDMDLGHRTLDALVKKIRADSIATLKHTPDPAA